MQGKEKFRQEEMNIYLYYSEMNKYILKYYMGTIQKAHFLNLVRKVQGGKELGPFHDYKAYKNFQLVKKTLLGL